MDCVEFKSCIPIIFICLFMDCVEFKSFQIFFNAIIILNERVLGHMKEEKHCLLRGCVANY
jgi:hypothetical protein